jgi:hypothetical protein
VCLAVVAVTAAALAKPELRAWLGWEPKRAPSYAIGGHVDVPPALYQHSPLTLLLFVRSNCPACQTAKDPAARVAAELRRRTIPTLVIAAGQQPAGEAEYVRSLALDASQLITLDLMKHRVQVVPTFVLVDSRGEVKYTKEGAPSAADEEALIRAADLNASSR